MSDPWKRKEQIGEFSVTFIDDERPVFIYAVSETETNPPIYIGSTAQVVKRRINAHAISARQGSNLPFHQWLRKHPEFTVKVMQTVPLSHRVEAEQRWVAGYSGLLNVTDGGPGMSGHRFAGTEHAKRIASKIRTSGEFTCLHCGGSFYRKLSQVAKGNSKFCSRKCYQNWQIGKPKERAA